MSSVAKMIETIETQMDAQTPEEGAAAPQAGVNPEHVRMVEALLFAASEPLDAKALSTSLPEGADVKAVIAELQAMYEKRGVNLCAVSGKYQFRTAADLAFLLRKEKPEQKRLSKAAIETLAIIAYHQPVTRAEIEDIRGVAISKGTIDQLMEIGWVRLRGRRKAPGRPITYGTTDTFLLHFSLETIGDLPGLDELKAAGMFDGRLPEGFGVPQPRDGVELTEDEDPLEDGAADLFEEQHLAAVEGEEVEASAEVVAEAEGEADAEADLALAEMEAAAEWDAGAPAEAVDEAVSEDAPPAEGDEADRR